MVEPISISLLCLPVGDLASELASANSSGAILLREAVPIGVVVEDCPDMDR